MKKTLLLILWLIPLPFFAQSNFTVSGTVKNNQGEAIPFANVVLDKDSKYAATDDTGTFLITNVKSGTYTLEISFIGYKTFSQLITVDKNTVLDATLVENTEVLEGVTVVEKTETTLQNTKPITITSLDLKELKSQALGVENVIKQSTGVVVRQSGGLGSTLNINLNGLTGAAVRQYYDGMPLELYAGSLQLNFIPVDVLDRVDVYKGILPVDVGTDALGGGFNLVPLKRSDDYLRASYSIGSFNTHRFTLSGNYNISKKVAVSMMSFVNYSDNDFEMKDITNITENLRPDGTVESITEEVIDVKRFHDAFRSSYVEGGLSFKDLGFADFLKVSAMYSTRFNEVQQGAFFTGLAVGEAEREGTAAVQRIKYEKSFFKNKINLSYSGLFSQSEDIVRDSSSAFYNWTGRLVTINRNGAELSPFPTARVGDNTGSAHRVTLNFDITDNIKFIASNFSSKTTIEGNDPLGIRIDVGDNTNLDPNTIPAVLKSNVFGAEINAAFFDKKLTTIAFYKNYRYDAESVDFTRPGVSEIPFRSVDATNDGYGFGIKYQITDQLFLRSSYEQTTRIPSQGEVFGNFAGVAPNFRIRPEQSNNINLGIRYSTTWDDDRMFSIDFGGFLRDQEDLIRSQAFGFERSQFVNQAESESRGFELSTRLVPIRNLSLNGSFTLQRIELGDTESLTSGEGSSEGLAVPNIPKLFFNLGARYKFSQVFKSKNDLELSWTYFFIDNYSINVVPDIDTANPEFVIPRQNVNNVDLTYVIPSKNLAFSFSIQNLFDQQVFDNFRIPRPGINYSLKVSYSLRRSIQ